MKRGLLMNCYTEEYLGIDEEEYVLASFSPVPKIILFIALGIFALISLICALTLTPVFLILLLVIAIIGVLLHFFFLKIELALTPQKIVGVTGLFTTRALDAPLEKVQNVQVIQDPIGKIFRYGTVIIRTASLCCHRFPFVIDPHNFKKAILEQFYLSKKEAAANAQTPTSEQTTQEPSAPRDFGPPPPPFRPSQKH